MNDLTLRTKVDLGPETPTRTSRPRLVGPSSREEANVYAVDKAKLKPIPSYKLLPKHVIKLNYAGGWSFQASAKKLGELDHSQKLLRQGMYASVSPGSSA